MKDAPPKTIYLKDYKAPSHLVNTIDLCFELDAEKTVVQSKMQMKRNLSEDAANGP